MAMGGLRPIVAIYSTFLTRAIDQVNLDVGLHGQPVIFCVDRAGITGDDGPSHHGVLDMVLCTKVPGMTVFAPSSYQEIGQMLRDALELTSGPVVIRWPKTAARSVNEDEIGHGLRGRRVRQGGDDAAVCILAVGKMLEAAEGAAAALVEDGIEATVWDVRLVKPLDAEMLADALDHPAVLTVEDGLREGGAGSAIGTALADLAYEQDRLPPPVRVLGTPVSYIPHGRPDDILASLGLDAAGVADAARQLVRIARG
jgi:1-deoxy-D-xylulose-5-phosphate synthase